MKYLSIVLLIILLSNCSTIDSEEILKSIVEVEQLSEYKYKTLVVQNTFDGNYFYTIYFKINLDSTYYQYLKDNKLDNCIPSFKYSNLLFESRKVLNGYYDSFNEEDIPKWFDHKNSKTDILTSFNTDSLKVVTCYEMFNAWVLLQYYNGNCYIIFDSAPQPD